MASFVLDEENKNSLDSKNIDKVTNNIQITSLTEISIYNLQIYF